MDIHTHKLYSRFPEELFPASDVSSYNKSLLTGMKVASKCNVLITGLCRNVIGTLDHTIARLYHTASFFGDYRFVVYENDSRDGTSESLLNHSIKDDKFLLIQENTGHKHFIGGREIERPRYLASLRNKCHTYIESLAYKPDFVIVIDLDLLGGWSYDGIMNSLAYGDLGWGAMTANGLQFRQKTITRKLAGVPDQELSEVERLFFDTWAYRDYGDEKLKICDIVNLYRFERGDPPIGVFSNFNGLGIYRPESIKGVRFGAEENKDGTVTNEWSYFHREMRKRGEDIFLNPSLITLYSPHEFSLKV